MISMLKQELGIFLLIGCLILGTVIIYLLFTLSGINLCIQSLQILKESNVFNILPNISENICEFLQILNK